MDARDRETINHNNPSLSNQDSPSIFTYANITRNQTPDQHGLNLHQRNQYHVFQDQQMEANREIRESNPYPYPDPNPVSQTPPPLDIAPVVRYRECLKNHAASRGTHAVDGCGEFMPNGEEGTPESLKCAACECHRSFHRREVDGEPQPTTIIHSQQPQPSRVAAAAAAAATMQLPHSYRYSHGHMQPMMVAFGGNSNVAQTESSSEDLDMFRTQQPSKKRFRTKFSEEQKEKMHDFAEKIGWKIQKQDEEEILQFCNEVGLKRKVFKVWMHNCKQASKKKQE